LTEKVNKKRGGQLQGLCGKRVNEKFRDKLQRQSFPTSMLDKIK